MNNILSFNEYNGYELERIAYDNVLNEKSSLKKGVRGFLNKSATGRIRSELADEIEMSKNIMDGIKNGLESLNDNFDVLKDSIDKATDDKEVGEKQKALDSIMKIIEDSRKNTWDINELIDEGEIDDTGFTANIGLASIAYFGILLTPFRAAIMIHKGYSYFFNIIKNTIRKALVMLQLNFDQFENLIITKGFQSLDYLQDKDTSVKISEFYGKLQAKLFDEKTGMMKGKRGSEYAKQQMQLAKNQIDAMMKADKSMKLSDNAYNCLDQYNNTYTRSLEALRQYSSDATQKLLDSIKNSMNKFAGQEADLQTYSELIIAAAEEHAYKVSSSIYNKFAKMTEVFNLPNQKKLIDLIQAATKEQMDDTTKKEKELAESDRIKKLKEDSDEREKKGLEVFKSIDGVEISEMDEDTKKYKDIKASNWTYDKFSKLSDEEQSSLEQWFFVHPEVLKECSKTLQVVMDTNDKDAGYYDYIDSLVDVISLCIDEGGKDEKKKKNESAILNFDQYVFESADEENEEEEVAEEETAELSDDEKKELDEKIEGMESNLGELLVLIFGKDIEDFSDLEVTPENRARLDYVLKKFDDMKGDEPKEEEESSEEEDDGLYEFPTPIKKLKKLKKEISGKGETKYYLNLSKARLDERQFNDIKALYKNRKVAEVVLKTIGKKVLKDNTFVKNSKNIVGIIDECIKSEARKKRISMMTCVLLKESIQELKDLRSHDYASIENEKKSEN